MLHVSHMFHMQYFKSYFPQDGQLSSEAVMIGALRAKIIEYHI